MPGTDRMSVWVGLRVILNCRRINQILAPGGNSNMIVCISNGHMVNVTGDEKQVKFRIGVPPLLPEHSFLPSGTLTKQHKTYRHKLA